MTFTSNLRTFASPLVVRHYRKLTRLQPPEETILAKLRDSLAGARMLDIGIGGGRTTVHFAPIVAEYVGVDFAAPMVEACRKRFDLSNARFEVCDVRSMTQFADGSFDFILFSYNGLDYIGHEDRLRALAEIRRVSRKDARFCFSSHNLESLPNKKLWRLWPRNPPLHDLLRCDWAIVNDGAIVFGLSTYYIRPEAQIAQLRSAGFTDVEVLAHSGTWLYYVCTAA